MSQMCDIRAWASNSPESPIAKSFTPSPDIAGIGVVTSFLASAWIALSLAIACYVLGLIPKELLSDFDLLFMHARPRDSPAWGKTFRKAVKKFGDQQIVTGIAILVAGFIQLDELSVYHWNVLVYLAWMASNVHLTSLTLLRTYLRETPGLRAWRVVGMSTLFVLLLVALVPTSRTMFQIALINGVHTTDDSLRSCALMHMPAHCYWSLDGLSASPWIRFGALKITINSCIAYSFLAVSFLWKLSMIFRTSGDCLIKWCRLKPLTFLEATIKSSASRKIEARTRERRMARSVTFGFLVAIYLPTLAVMERFSSFAGSLFLILLSLIWGTLQVLMPRRRLSHDFLYAENLWGFGQLLPMLLLALPLLGVCEYMTGTKQRQKNSRSPLGEAREVVVNVPTLPIVSTLADSSGVTIPGRDQQFHALRSNNLSVLLQSISVDDSTNCDELHQIIYTSWAFKSLLCWVAISVASIFVAGVTFTFGAVGQLNFFTPGHSITFFYADRLWAPIAFGATGLVGFLWVSCCVAAIWSRLYR